eukprot:jgi/Phyca11/97382/e_gw1.1.1760.1
MSKRSQKRHRSLAVALDIAGPATIETVYQENELSNVASCNSDAISISQNGNKNSRARSPPTAASLPQLYIEKLVAYSPAKETWLSGRVFGDAGSAFIVGCVARYDKKKALFQVHWLDTQFQKADKWISMSIVKMGMENYKNVVGSPTKPGWRSLCQSDNTEIGIGENDSDLEEVDEEQFESYNPEVVIPSSMREVESIRNMNFDPAAQIDGPSNLYQHPDTTIKTRVRPQFRHLFEHSATASFFCVYTGLLLGRSVTADKQSDEGVSDGTESSSKQAVCVAGADDVFGNTVLDEAGG